MSQENVDTIRRAYDAFNRGDLDAVVAGLAEDVEWHQETGLPDRAVYRGRDAVKTGLLEGQFVEQFDELWLTIDEFVEVGEDHVVAIGSLSSRGRTSGLDFSLRFVHVFKLRDGKAIWVYDCAGESRRP